MYERIFKGNEAVRQLRSRQGKRNEYDSLSAASDCVPERDNSTHFPDIVPELVNYVENRIDELYVSDKLSSTDLLDLWDCLEYWNNEVPTSYESWGVYFDMLNEMKHANRLRFEWTAA